MTLDETQATGGALANTDPKETVVVSLSPPPGPRPHGDRDGRISQTTEHLLIAAGSIGEHLSAATVGSLLTHSRCNYCHCYDYTGSLHNAKARSHISGSRAAWQEPSAPWTSTSTQVRHGHQATVRGRLRVCKEQISISSSSGCNRISVRLAFITDTFASSRSK